VKVTRVALVRDGAAGVANGSCSTVPVKLLAGAVFVARLVAGRMVTSSMDDPSLWMECRVPQHSQIRLPWCVVASRSAGAVVGLRSS
jgi:hypothetical protein